VVTTKKKNTKEELVNKKNSEEAINPEILSGS